MEGKRLLLVDGSAVMHRAYHAMPGLTDRQGRPTGALYGFVRILLKTMKDLQPTHVAVAFDRREPTFRKEMYIAYQAQREVMDDDLGEQFDRVRELLEAMEVPVYDKAGFEADDIIGTIAEQVVPKSSKFKVQSSKLADEVIILTGDRDLMQLVNERVKLCLPVKGMNEEELVGIKEVEERLGVRPGQVVDYKALVGDASDNYPGVPGIGPKTAVELLEKFGSFEAIYELGIMNHELREENSKLKTQNSKLQPKTQNHNSEFIIRDSTKKKLLEGKAGGELSKQLATIKMDVDVDFKIEDCEAVVKQPGRLARVLGEFGFQSLVKLMGLEEAVGNGNEQMRLV